MDKLPPFVKPDELYRVNLEGLDRHFMVNQKYDRVDFIRPLGSYMLKFYDDDDGLATLFVDEETAKRVAEYADLPIVERDTVLQSEWEGHLKAQEASLEDWLKDD